MAELAEQWSSPSPHRLLAGLVRAGLAEFCRLHLPAEDGMSELLQRAAAEQLEPGAPSGWTALREWAARSWPPTSGPIGRFARDHALSLPRAFLLALAGEAEREHDVVLALSELDGAAGSARLSTHLAVALLQSLFGERDYDALSLHEDWLLQTRLLRWVGDGPLPLRTLQIEPSLWAVLCDRPASWPGCRRLAAADRHLLPLSVRSQLPGLAAVLSRGEALGLVIRGTSGSGRSALAAELALTMGLSALEVPPDTWAEPAFSIACRYAGWLPVIRPLLGAGETWSPPASPIGVPFVCLLGMDGATAGADVIELELAPPGEAERHQIWSRQLGDPALAAQAKTARLSGAGIARVARNVKLRAAHAGVAPSLDHIVRARQELGADRLRLLAHPVLRRVERDAVVFSPLVDQLLAQFIERAQHRESIWSGLGATLRASHNCGLRALFVGESGTGKTLAASYVATALGAPLYRVDLAAIMNKYVGETEKSLGGLLDAAASADALLLFDEADSLFGQRTEAKQHGERYANMLTNFLLTRIENHPGITILTTNHRERIDGAFTRRLDLIVEFPLPGFRERLELWNSHLGRRSPGAEVCRALASHCDLSGGQIRNAVLTAACFDTPASSEPIAARHLVDAVQREYQKLGRALPPQLQQLGR